MSATRSSLDCNNSNSLLNAAVVFARASARNWAIALLVPLGLPLTLALAAATAYGQTTNPGLSLSVEKG
jgi:hypothetical protein